MDNTVKVWDVATGECLHTLTGHTSLVGLLGSSPNYLVSAAADASLRIWDANSHELKHTLGSHGGAITCFKHDEAKVVSGSDGTLKLWDMRTGAYVRDLVIGISSVWQVSFHGNLLVAASNRQGSTVFDVFNFGHNGFATDVDNDELDKLRRPPWERKDPREPQAYQADEMDFEITSPRSATSRAQSVDIDQWVRGNSSSRAAGSRRSSRLREKAMGSSSVRAAYSASYSIEPPPRTKRSALRTEAGSPSPAGPSRTAQMLGLAGESFAPIFDDDKGDEPTDEGDDVVC